MKILFLLTELAPGGAERVVLDLSEGLLRKGHTVLLAVLAPPPEEKFMEDSFRRLGVVPCYAGMTKKHFLPGLFRLRKYLLSEKPDVVHSHLMHPNLISRLLKLENRFPLVNTVHISERRPGKELFFLLDGFTSGLCDVFTAVSGASARFHEKKCTLKTGTIRTVRNGCNPVVPLTLEERKERRMHWVGSMCSRVLGSWGRLDSQKGYDLLLNAAEKLVSRIPADEIWVIVILGDGPERERLEEMTRRLASNRLLVKFPGYTPDAARDGDAMDVFLMPSRYEGYGLALAEAMNLGLPVVYNPVDSLPEVAEGYPNAFPADFNSPEKAADQILRVATVPRCTGRTVRTREEMTEEYLDIYRELVKHD